MLLILAYLKIPVAVNVERRILEEILGVLSQSDEWRVVTQKPAGIVNRFEWHRAVDVRQPGLVQGKPVRHTQDKCDHMYRLLQATTARKYISLYAYYTNEVHQDFGMHLLIQIDDTYCTRTFCAHFLRATHWKETALLRRIPQWHLGRSVTRWKLML